MTPGEEQHFDWRRGGAAAGGLIATLVLLAMVFLVAIVQRRPRTRARGRTPRLQCRAGRPQRRFQHVARGSGARPVRRSTRKSAASGNIYYSQWRLAGHQISQLEPAGAHQPRPAPAGAGAPGALCPAQRRIGACGARRGCQAGPGRDLLLLRRRPVADRPGGRPASSTKSPTASAIRCATASRRARSSPPRPTG